MAGGARKVSIGFQGGQVLALRIDDDAYKALAKSLEGGGWQEIESEDGPVRINLGQVVYVSADTDEPRVGFG